MSPYKRSLSELLERKNKKKDFSQSVVEKFKPKINRKKR